MRRLSHIIEFVLSVGRISGLIPCFLAEIGCIEPEGAKSHMLTTEILANASNVSKISFERRCCVLGIARPYPQARDVASAIGRALELRMMQQCESIC